MVFRPLRWFRGSRGTGFLLALPGILLILGLLLYPVLHSGPSR